MLLWGNDSKCNHDVLCNNLHHHVSDDVNLHECELHSVDMLTAWIGCCTDALNTSFSHQWIDSNAHVRICYYKKTRDTSYESFVLWMKQWGVSGFSSFWSSLVWLSKSKSFRQVVAKERWDFYSFLKKCVMIMNDCQLSDQMCCLSLCSLCLYLDCISTDFTLTGSLK